jgi:flavin-dependent dehydrogenase
LKPYDVFVAGGGPAGSALAITAARAGLGVLLAERQELPLRKVCGEFLSACGLELWQELTGKSPPPSMPRLSTARFFSRRWSTPVIAIDPPAAGLTRSFLDGSLIEGARMSGVEVEMGTQFLWHSPAAESFQVKVRGPAGEKVILARHVVLATGRPVLKSRRKAWWFGRKATCDPVRTRADLEMFFLSGGGYVGLSPVETGQMSLCALTRDPGDAWLTHPSREGSKVEVGRSVARFVLGLQDGAADEALRIGDALSVWPPIVGDGITVALASGLLLGRLIATAARNEPVLSSRDWLCQWRKAFEWKLKVSLALHRMAVSRPGRAALLSLSRWLPASGEWLVRATRTGKRSALNLTR